MSQVGKRLIKEMRDLQIKICKTLMKTGNSEKMLHLSQMLGNIKISTLSKTVYRLNVSHEN